MASPQPKTKAPARRKPAVLEHPNLDTPSVSMRDYMRDYMDATVKAVYERIDAVVQRLEALEKRVEALEKRVDALVEEMRELKEEMRKMEQRLRKELRSDLRWAVGVVLSVIVPMQIYIISQL